MMKQSIILHLCDFQSRFSGFPQSFRKPKSADQQFKHNVFCRLIQINYNLSKLHLLEGWNKVVFELKLLNFLKKYLDKAVF